MQHTRPDSTNYPGYRHRIGGPLGRRRERGCGEADTSRRVAGGWAQSDECSTLPRRRRSEWLGRATRSPRSRFHTPPARGDLVSLTRPRRGTDRPGVGRGEPDSDRVLERTAERCAMPERRLAGRSVDRLVDELAEPAPGRARARTGRTTDRRRGGFGVRAVVEPDPERRVVGLALPGIGARLFGGGS